MLLSTVTVMAAKPVVKMAPSIFTYGMRSNNIALDQSTKDMLWSRIYNKLSSMQAAGKLPFELAGESATRGHSVNEMMLDSGAVYIVPTVMVNSSKDSSYSTDSSTAYTSTVVSGVSLIFAMIEENYDTGATSMKMLGMIPMMGADTIGQPTYDKQLKKYVGMHNTPISSAEKLQKFVSLANGAIDEQIDFGSSMKNLKDKNVEFNHDVYQVTNVKISSQNAINAFPGQEADDLKFLVAYYYTAAYQQKNKKLVYPPVGGDKMANAVVDMATSISLDSVGGKVDVTMMNPAHKITLDITGANNVYADNLLSYRVWLAKSPVEGKEKAELERGMARPMKMNDGVKIDHSDMYRLMLIGLARELGGQKI